MSIMHTLISLHAFVLGSAPEGEANKVLTLLTETHGLVRAHAQGIRLERSKLRYLVTDGAQVQVTLVRGRDVWRLVNAREVEGVCGSESLVVRAALRRVRALTLRLVRGEGDPCGTYALLCGGFMALCGETDVASVRLREALLVARLLAAQGYLRVTQETSHLIHTTSYEVHTMVQSDLRTLIRSVNEALRESHL